MSLFPDPSTVTHGIQLAVAPVFLLTAVAGMIGAVAGRLARIIDRARILEERLRDPAKAEFAAQDLAELDLLGRRGHLSNAAIGLLTACSFLIGLTILVLFLGETTAFDIDRFAIWTFLAGVFCFMSASACFMTETFLATRIMGFGKRRL